MNRSSKYITVILALLVFYIGGCGGNSCVSACEKLKECDYQLLTETQCKDACNAGYAEGCPAYYSCVETSSCADIVKGKCNNLTQCQP